jgi:hypothetical protein
VPEEFAAAYRAAYERALAAQTGGAQHRVEPEELAADEPTADEPTADEPTADEPTGDEPADEARADDDTDELGAQPLPSRRGPLRIGTHRAAELPDDEEDDGPTWYEQIRDSAWFVPFLLALLALLLVFGAYAVGRRFAGEVAQKSSTESEPRVVLGEGEDSGDQPITNQKPGHDAWDGKVRRIGNIKADVDCVSKSGVDASGKTVEYDAGNLTDGVADTTWRCDGSAVGKKITLRLGKDVPIGQVGLIPGYAKTDEKSNDDRFAENNRITRVRWTVGKTKVVQKMSGSATDRDLQLIRVPRTTTDTVTLQILALKKGPRDTTAISEIQLGRAG